MNTLGEQLLIRPLTAADVPALLALQEACYPPVLHDDEETIVRFVREAPVALGAEEDRLLVGAILVAYAHEDAPLELYSVEVLPAARRRGVAFLLVTEALPKAPPCRLLAHCTPEGACLLVTFGFRPTGLSIVRGGVSLRTFARPADYERVRDNLRNNR